MEFLPKGFSASFECDREFECIPMCIKSRFLPKYVKQNCEFNVFFFSDFWRFSLNDS